MSEKILLVEREEGSEFLITKLIAEGTDGLFQTVCVPDLPRALEYMDDHDFSVVLLDLASAGVPGPHAVAALQAAAPAVPIVILALPDMLMEAFKAADEGAADFLFKHKIKKDTLAHALNYARKAAARKKAAATPAGSHDAD
jgi:DNA-binding NtrC family response regulator